MNVSLQLTKTAHSSDAGKRVVLRDVDLDTALAISAALRDLPHADLEAVIVVENLSPAQQPARRPARQAVRASRQSQPARAGLLSGWLRGFSALALAR